MAQKQIYGIILIGATILREAGQGRNPAALSECELCALFASRIYNISEN